jgi:hypothetical protein
MKGFTRTMTLNRNLTKTLLAAAVALGTLCSSSAAFAATGGPAASTAKAPLAKERALKSASRLQTRPSGPGYTGGKAHADKIVADTPEYAGGKADRFLTRPSGPSYEGGKAGRPLIRTSGPEYDGG